MHMHTYRRWTHGLPYRENTFIACDIGVQSVLVKKTIYGRCPKCKAKSDLVVISGDPGREKFKCNQCYHVFGMDEL